MNTVSTRIPAWKARSRSTVTWISGLRSMNEELTFPKIGLWRKVFTSASVYSLSLARSGPRTKNCRSARPPPITWTPAFWTEGLRSE